MEGEYSPLKVSIIIILGTIIFIVVGILYSNKTKVKKYLICDSKTDYKEQLKFTYSNDILSSYNREEYFTFKSKNDLEKWEKHFNQEKEKLILDKYFKYEVESKDFNLIVKTYIDVPNRNDFFDQYIKDFNINYLSTLKQVKKSLEKLNYDCKVK